MDQLKAKRDALFAEWTRGASKNVKSIHDQLEALKLILSQITFQPGENSVTATTLVHCRDILEIGAFFSIEERKIDSFERYIAQLKVFYFDYKDIEGLGESANKFLLLGLNLMRLLSQNRLAEFHTELELMRPDVILTNDYIKHPLLLEQYLMEGSYNKVFKSKHQNPSPYYTIFTDILLNSIKAKVATPAEQPMVTSKVASQQLASQILDYAIELEKIV